MIKTWLVPFIAEIRLEINKANIVLKMITDARCNDGIIGSLLFCPNDETPRSFRRFASLCRAFLQRRQISKNKLNLSKMIAPKIPTTGGKKTLQLPGTACQSRKTKATSLVKELLREKKSPSAYHKNYLWPNQTGSQLYSFCIIYTSLEVSLDCFPDIWWRKCKNHEWLYVWPAVFLFNVCSGKHCVPTDVKLCQQPTPIETVVLSTTTGGTIDPTLNFDL